MSADDRRIQQPLTLPCGATLPNRIAKSAMSEQLGDLDNNPTDELLTLYRRWGAGGIGLLISGNVMMDRRSLTEAENVAVEDDRALEGLRAWAENAQAKGAHLWMQLNHPGRQSPRAVSVDTVSASDVGLKGFGPLFARPRALEDHEVEEIVARFARAAGLAKAAGFSGVQIHGAHGYLVSQFLSPYTNRREDRWGGSPENRRRFLIEILRAIRSEVGPDFPIGLKLNSADFQRGGFDEEESRGVIAALNDEGLDLLEISGGTYERTEMWRSDHEQAKDSTRNREAFFLEYAESVRELATMPVMLTGGFRSSAAMDQALDSGAIDVVGLARPLCVEPNLPARLLADPEARAADIRLSTGIKALDSMIESGWYTAQIKRLGQGKDPEPRSSRLRALCRVFWANLSFGRKRQPSGRGAGLATVK